MIVYHKIICITYTLCGHKDLISCKGYKYKTMEALKLSQQFWWTSKSSGMSTGKQLPIFWKRALLPFLGPSSPRTAGLLKPDDRGSKLLPNVHIYLPVNKAFQSRSLGFPLQNNLLRHEIKNYPLTQFEAGSTTDHVLPSHVPHASKTVDARLRKKWDTLCNATW